MMRAVMAKLLGVGTVVKLPFNGDPERDGEGGRPADPVPHPGCRQRQTTALLAHAA